MLITKYLGMIIILVITITLSGCVSAAFTGARMIYNRHDLQVQADNNLLNLQVINTLKNDKQLKYKNDINVSTFNYVVLLTGQVATAELRQHAVNIVKKIPKVKRIINAIQVRGSISTGQELKDTWITTKIKAKFLGNGKIDMPKIKVVTENGIVYLMGNVTPEQARIAINIAKNTRGVREVIKVFRYIQLTDTENPKILKNSHAK